MVPLMSFQRYKQRDPGFRPDFSHVVPLSGDVLCYQYVAGAENALRPVPYLDLYRPSQVETSSSGRVMP